MNQPSTSFNPPKVSEIPRTELPWANMGESAGFAEALRFLRRRGAMIVGCILGTIALAALTVMVLQPRYTGSATLVFARSDTRLLQTADFESETIDFSAIETELDVLRTRLFLGRVVDELKLVDDPTFNPSLGPQTPSTVARIAGWPIKQLKAAFGMRSAGVPVQGNSTEGAKRTSGSAEAERDRAIARLRSGMRVWRSGDSLAVSIQVTRSDPKSAANLANAIGNIYIDWSIALKRRAADEFFNFFRTRAQRLETRVAELEREIATFSAQNGLAASRADDILRVQIDSLGGNLARAMADQAAATARLEISRGLDPATPPESAATPGSSESIVTSPLLAKLRGDLADLTRRQAEMAANLGPNHPDMQAMAAQIALTREAIVAEIERTIDESQQEVHVLEQTIERYRSELATLDQKLRVRAVAEIQLREMESNLVFERRRYDEVVESLGTLDRQIEVLTPSARFLSEAALPTEPSFPNVPVIMIGSGIASAVLAVMLALLVEGIDHSIRTTAQLRRMTFLPNLGMLPRPRRGWFRGLTEGRVGDGRASRFAAALEEIWCAFANAHPDDRVLMVASGLPSEGRAELAIGLAATAALKGRRVLVIGLDASEPYATLSGLGADAALLSDVLAGRVPVDSGIVRGARPNRLAFVLRASADESLDQERLDDFFRSLPDAFDLIVVDAPPLLVGHESDVVARVADAVVVAVYWGKSVEHTVAETLELARERGYPLVGTVITGVNERAHALRGYGGRSQYRARRTVR